MQAKKIFKYITIFTVTLIIILSLSIIVFATLWISKDTVKEISYKNAGILENEVTSIEELKFYHFDNIYVHKFIFYTSNAKYVYHINAATGDIINCEISVLDNNNTHNSAVITTEKALSIAIDESGASNFIKQDVKLNNNKNIYYYEVELKTNDNTKYKYEINALTSEVITSNLKTSYIGKIDNSSFITPEKALSIVMTHTQLSFPFLKEQNVELDNNKDTYYYEVELKTNNNTKYEYEVSASTGKIINSESKNSYVDNSGNAIIITSKQALSIAILDAGLSELSLKEYKIELDNKENESFYKIELKDNNDLVYKYKINSSTSKIIDSQSKDLYTDDKSSSIITSKEALSIAITHAGLSFSSLREHKVELEDNRYKVDLKANNDIEYEYEISIYTGEILSYEYDD